LRAFVAGYNFNGSIYYIKIWSGGDRNTGTLVCNLVGGLDNPIDKTGTHYFTKSVSGAGDITTLSPNKEFTTYTPLRLMKNLTKWKSWKIAFHSKR